LPALPSNAPSFAFDKTMQLPELDSRQKLPLNKFSGCKQLNHHSKIVEFISFKKLKKVQTIV